MRPFRDTISLDAAREIISHTGVPVESTETIPIDRARNRVVSKDIIASADVPPFARAAMDGYAVRAADTQGASRASARSLRLTATLYTGRSQPRRSVKASASRSPRAHRCRKARTRW